MRRGRAHRFDGDVACVRFSVADTGPGIAIACSIVESHGGRIAVGSEVGRGTSFWFDIPAV